MSRRSTSKLKTMGVAERIIMQLPRTGLATDGQLEHLATVYPQGGQPALQALLNLMSSGVVDCVIWARESWVGDSIGSVTGIGGDKLHLMEPVTMPPTGGCNLLYTEGCLEAMLKQLQESVKKVTHETALQTTVPLMELVKDVPRQVCMMVQRIRFTTEVQKCIRENRQLSIVSRANTALKNNLSERLLKEKEIPEGERTTIMAIQILLHEQDSVLKELMEIKTDQWEAWQERMRFFHDDKDKSVSLRITINGAEKALVIGDEYSPPTPLVVTAFTHTLRAAYLEAMMEGGPRMLVLIGPTASGKTGMLCNFGQLLGMLPTVVRGSERSPSDDPYWRRRMSSAKTTGGGLLAPVIIAEADRMSEKALSVALSAATEFGVAICLTMSPGDAAVRCCATLPEGVYPNYIPAGSDMQTVAAGRLAAEGLQNANNELGVLMSFILESLQKNCSKQPHYDFGTRTLMQLCTQIGVDRKKDGNEKESVCKILQRCLLPKLVKDDVQVLAGLLRDSFGVATCEKSSEDGRWVGVSANIHSITKHEPDCIVLPVPASEEADFHESFCKMLNKDGSALVKLEGKLCDMSAELLMGAMPKKGEPVKDGVLVSLLRKTMEDHPDENQTVWIWMNTGSMNNATWESLHELLNDSHCLNLATGEQIRLSHNLRFLFVMEKAGDTAQDTFSRAAVVYTDP